MIIKLFICIVLAWIMAFAQQPSELTLDSIHTEMDKIVKGHVTIKKITPEFLAKGLERYISQFDPYAVYLLESDVKPFITLSHIYFHF